MVHSIHYGLSAEEDALLEHFKNLRDQNRIPALTSILLDAHTLSQRYSSEQAYLRALSPVPDHQFSTNSWNQISQPVSTDLLDPPKDSEWVNRQQVSNDEPDDGASTVHGLPHKKGGKERALLQSKFPMPPQFGGDHALANSILLMRDGLYYKELVLAVSIGDSGRMWEIFKVRIARLGRLY